MTRFVFNRRRTILGIGAALTMIGVKQTVAAGGDFASRLAEMQRDGRVAGLHAVLVARGNRLVFEYYGQGEDESWGAPLGKVTFGPTVLHDLRSVTKSMVGMLYGIALAGGKVPAPEARLYDQFPEYPDLATQPGRDRITVAHALSMTMGTEWDELTHPYGDSRNSENAMDAAPDRYRFILALPIVGEPGVKWTYCGGATALLGRLIAKGTGEKLTDYARARTFRSARARAHRMVDGS
jgi:CubicO group peptidase (beta-lactamase class C family)